MFRFQAVRRVALLVLVVPAVALAQGKSGSAKGKGESKSQAKVVGVFRGPDKPAMRDYFRANKMVATPLPPGIAKNLARGKPLPQGIAKRPAPHRLVAMLPASPGITYLIVGDNVVAMRQGVVVDVLYSVF